MTSNERTYDFIVVREPDADLDDGEQEPLLPAVAGEGDWSIDHFLGLKSRKPALVGMVTRCQPPVTASELAEADRARGGLEDSEIDAGRLTDIGFMLEAASNFGEGARLGCRYSGKGLDDVVWEVFGSTPATVGHWRGELATVQPEPLFTDEQLDALAIDRRLAAERAKEEAIRRSEQAEAGAAERRAAKAAKSKADDSSDKGRKRRGEADRASDEPGRRRRRRGRSPRQQPKVKTAELAAIEQDPALADWLDVEPEPYQPDSDFVDPPSADEGNQGRVSAASFDPDLADWLDDSESVLEETTSSYEVASGGATSQDIDPDLADWLDGGVDVNELNVDLEDWLEDADQIDLSSAGSETSVFDGPSETAEAGFDGEIRAQVLINPPVEHDDLTPMEVFGDSVRMVSASEKEAVSVEPSVSTEAVVEVAVADEPSPVQDPSSVETPEPEDSPAESVEAAQPPEEPVAEAGLVDSDDEVSADVSDEAAVDVENKDGPT